MNFMRTLFKGIKTISGYMKKNIAENQLDE